MADNSTEGRTGPIYYGKPAAGSNGPAYYSGGTYYGGSYYGGGAYYGGRPGEDGGESVLGTITLGRVLRVIRQRWISVFVCFLVGLIVAFAVYRISPTVYESSATFTIDIGSKHGQRDALRAYTPEYGTGYEEILNTRLPTWRSGELLLKVADKYLETHSDSQIQQNAIVSILGGADIELTKRSRLIKVSVRSDKKELAADLATEYVRAIEAATSAENRERANIAVAQTQDDADKANRKIMDIDAKIRDIEMQNQLSSKKTRRELMDTDLKNTAKDVSALESAEANNRNIVEILDKMRETPENFAALPDGVPRGTEINKWYDRYREASLNLAKLRASGALKQDHPKMQEAEISLAAAITNFNDSVQSAYKTSCGNLEVVKVKAQNARAKRDKLQGDLAQIDAEITRAETQLTSFKRQLSVENGAYTEILKKLADARTQAESNLEKVHLIDNGKATPAVQILPKPEMIFAVGAILGLAVGLLFVLILDHLEDAIVGISDIEQRLSLRVLAVLPHVRRKKREQVARFVSDDKYSQFAEAVAGLRNLLDSPRYQMSSRVLLIMSTQPGEGKTITSCSIAISNAQAGRKTLLVDFDLRRPRHATVWGVKTDKEHSLAHVLTEGDESKFDTMTIPSGVENLDLAVSLAPEGVNPASLMGSQIVPDFFRWARAKYERIIVDSPPYGIVGDVMTLASLVDSVVVMCRPDRTRFKPIQHATRHLTEAGATVLGVVVNDVELSAGSAFMQSSNSYGYGQYGYRSYASYGYRPKGENAGGHAAQQEGAAKKPAEGGEKKAVPDRATEADVADDD